MFRFEKNDGIIVLAATNRRDYLDSALLRPGRFDSEVYISPPDLRGRKDIFELYLSKVIHDRSIDTEYLAKGTTGFTGADIENMVNQVCFENKQQQKTHVLFFRLHFMLHKSRPHLSL
jgi:ATP-dependent Zn protease